MGTRVSVPQILDTEGSGVLSRPGYVSHFSARDGIG